MQTQPTSPGFETSGGTHDLEQPAARCGERRTAIRYPLEIPVVFRWVERGQERESHGCTRDVSVRGTFVHSGDCPPRGARVAIKLKFPALLRRRAERVDGAGLVLRVERPSAVRDGGFVIESTRGRLFT